MNPGTDWIEQGRRLLETLRAPAADGTPPDGANGSDCRWCPVCQAAAVVRGERPEVTAALADVLTTAAAALRTFAEAADPTAPADEAETGSEEYEDPPSVQRIEIA